MKIKLFLVFFNILLSHSTEYKEGNPVASQDIIESLDRLEFYIENNKLNAFSDSFWSVEAAVIASKNEEFRARLDSYNAGFHFLLKDFDKFNFYINRSFDYYKHTTNKSQLIYIYNMKALHLMYTTKDYKSAAKLFKKALALGENSEEKIEKNIVDVYFNLTNLYNLTENWDVCYATSVKAIDIAIKYNMRSRLLRLLYCRGNALYHLGDKKGAIETYKKCERIAREKEANGDYIFYRDALYLKGFSELYEKLGDHQRSAEYLREYNDKMSNAIDDHIQELSSSIKKNSDLLANHERLKKIEAESDLKETKLLLHWLITFFSGIIILGLIIIIVQQKRHQKNNLYKNKLLTKKNNELEQAKQQVESALSVKTDFLNGITHELRTPLYAINSITHMLKEKKSTTIEPSQIDILSFSGDHLMRFINNVISFNEGCNKTQYKSLDIASHNLKELLFDLKRTVKFSQTGDHGNRYVFNIDKKIPDILEFDILKFSRVIINLLNNASKHTKNGDIILSAQQINSDCNTSTIEFAVKDTGKGISKTQLNEIYSAFKNNQNFVPRIGNKSNGLGLGLVMIYRILKLYNSELKIDTKKGEGTTFKFVIKFDVVNSKRESNIPCKNETACCIEAENLNVLIVDDNKVNQVVTKNIANHQGITCDVVNDGYSALEKLKSKHKYDFVLMDIMMPKIDGFETTKLIKSSFPNQRVIALTALTIDKDDTRFKNSGFDGIIPKPFKLETFKTTLNSFLLQPIT